MGFGVDVVLDLLLEGDFLFDHGQHVGLEDQELGFGCAQDSDVPVGFFGDVCIERGLVAEEGF